MLNIATAGFTALFLTASPLAYAQLAPGASGQRPSPEDLTKLTDARIEIVKLALQLTPEQMKFWPAIEDAIKFRAQSRVARISTTAETVGERRAEGAADTLRNRDPVEFLNRRAEALAQHAVELKKLADAWQPLYTTLTPEQKRRMGIVTVFIVREARASLEDE